MHSLKNPFKNPDNIDNFPPFPDGYFDYQESTFGENEEIAKQTDETGNNTTLCSLNLSIDTLAKIRPVDISNVSTFLEQKEKEELQEELLRNEIEQEDQQYFDNRAEELSPQTKDNVRIVLLDENGLNQQYVKKRDIVTSPASVQTNLSISPTMNMEYTIYDSCIQFDDSQANIKTPKRKKRIITPKIPDFLSPIRAESPTTNCFQSPIMSPFLRTYQTLITHPVSPSTPSRTSYPFNTRHPKIGISSPSSSPTKLTYTRPLSPINYEFFKARYRTQIRYLEEQVQSSNL